MFESNEKKEIFRKIAPPHPIINSNPESAYYHGLTFVVDRFRVNGSKTYEREITPAQFESMVSRMLSREPEHYTKQAVDLLKKDGFVHRSEIGSFEISRTNFGNYLIKNDIQ